MFIILTNNMFFSSLHESIQAEGPVCCRWGVGREARTHQASSQWSNAHDNGGNAHCRRLPTGWGGGANPEPARSGAPRRCLAGAARRYPRLRLGALGSATQDPLLSPGRSSGTGSIFEKTDELPDEMDTRYLPDSHLAAALEKPLAQCAARGAAANERRSEWTHDWLAGAPGLEPGNGGIKIRCLTTWLRPIAACGAVMTARLAQVRSRGRTILVGPDWINAASVSKLTFLACGLE
jgi:hypothetical protein